MAAFCAYVHQHTAVTFVSQCLFSVGARQTQGQPREPVLLPAWGRRRWNVRCRLFWKIQTGRDNQESPQPPN